MLTKKLPARLNTQKAADYLGVPKTFLERDRFEAGQSGTPPKVPFLRFGRRTILYNVSDLDMYLSSSRIA
ncbi:hypothetical protein [Leisingera thetidis]|uniref:hypothetical protein n=1 Tax=Leisingera thetidis TaxID=2930199 RepID=UPI0021F71B25|nr:hypothetical protein [Leisingera thetidis]